MREPTCSRNWRAASTVGDGLVDRTWPGGAPGALLQRDRSDRRARPAPGRRARAEARRLGPAVGTAGQGPEPDEGVAPRHLGQTHHLPAERCLRGCVLEPDADVDGVGGPQEPAVGSVGAPGAGDRGDRGCAGDPDDERRARRRPAAPVAGAPRATSVTAVRLPSHRATAPSRSAIRCGGSPCPPAHPTIHPRRPGPGQGCCPPCPVGCAPHAAQSEAVRWARKAVRMRAVAPQTVSPTSSKNEIVKSEPQCSSR